MFAAAHLNLLQVAWRVHGCGFDFGDIDLGLYRRLATKNFICPWALLHKSRNVFWVLLWSWQDFHTTNHVLKCIEVDFIFISRQALGPQRDTDYVSPALLLQFCHSQSDHVVCSRLQFEASFSLPNYCTPSEVLSEKSSFLYMDKDAHSPVLLHLPAQKSKALALISLFSPQAESSPSGVLSDLTAHMTGMDGNWSRCITIGYAFWCASLQWFQ